MKNASAGGMSRDDLEVEHDLLCILSELVRPVNLPRRAIRAAILAALADAGMPEDDCGVIRDWLKDVRAGRL